jgi:hypothetical protein
MVLGTNTLILFLTKCAPFAAISTPQGSDPSLGAAVKSADAPLTLQGRISARPRKNARLKRAYRREQGRALMSVLGEAGAGPIRQLPWSDSVALGGTHEN